MCPATKFITFERTDEESFNQLINLTTAPLFFPPFFLQHLDRMVFFWQEKCFLSLCYSEQDLRWLGKKICTDKSHKYQTDFRAPCSVPSGFFECVLTNRLRFYLTLPPRGHHRNRTTKHTHTQRNVRPCGTEWAEVAAAVDEKKNWEETPEIS